MFQKYEQKDNNHNLIHNNTKQLKKVPEENSHKDMSRYGRILLPGEQDM